MKERVPARYTDGMDWDRLPGGRIVEQGLRDLSEGRETEASLLVQIGGPRLRRLGLAVQVSPERRAASESPEHRLYERLRSVEPDAAHSRYNALIRLLVSFERAAECAG